jgi:hypothetical protein
MPFQNLPEWDDNVTNWDQSNTFWDVSQNVLQSLPVNPNTVYIPFTPASNSNFKFQCTLDGNQYIAIVNWNLAGERYYVNLYDTSQNLIFCLPLIGSPNFYNISLSNGYFTDMLVYRVGSGNFEIIAVTT